MITLCKTREFCPLGLLAAIAFQTGRGRNNREETEDRTETEGGKREADAFKLAQSNDVM